MSHFRGEKIRKAAWGLACEADLLRNYALFEPQNPAGLSDKPIAREVSQDWNVNVSYAEDGSVVELVILDAVKTGFMPFGSGERKAA